jgi:hypothetical protein
MSLLPIFCALAPFLTWREGLLLVQNSRNFYRKIGTVFQHTHFDDKFICKLRSHCMQLLMTLSNLRMGVLPCEASFLSWEQYTTLVTLSRDDLTIVLALDKHSRKIVVAWGTPIRRWGQCVSPPKLFSSIEKLENTLPVAVLRTIEEANHESVGK